MGRAGSGRGHGVGADFHSAMGQMGHWFITFNQNMFCFIGETVVAMAAGRTPVNAGAKKIPMTH